MDNKTYNTEILKEMKNGTFLVKFSAENEKTVVMIVSKDIVESWTEKKSLDATSTKRFALGTPIFTKKQWYIFNSEEQIEKERDVYDFDDEDYGSSVAEVETYIEYKYQLVLAEKKDKQIVISYISETIDDMKYSEMYGDWMEGQIRPSEEREKLLTQTLYNQI